MAAEQAKGAPTEAFAKVDAKAGSGSTAGAAPEQKEPEDLTIDNLDEMAPDNSGLIKNHVITAMGLGLVPVPVFDVVSIVAVQLNMIRKLAQSHDVPFAENAVRGSVLSLIGGVLPASLGVTAASLLKSIPGLGSIAGAAGVVVLAGAVTYAVGHVFDRHLASGGTLLNFDASKARDLFRRKFEEGKGFASKLRGEGQADGADAATSDAAANKAA